MGCILPRGGTRSRGLTVRVRSVQRTSGSTAGGGVGAPVCQGDIMRIFS